MKSQKFAPMILILSLAACHPGEVEDTTSDRERLDQNLAPKEVQLVQAEVREEQPTVSLVGEVRSFDSVAISSEIAGRVEKVHVEVGDRVKAGQPLVQVDRAAFKMRLQQVEARLKAMTADLELARRALERKRDLLSDKTIPEATFDEAQARHDLADAAVLEAQATRDLAQRDFELSIIRAPASGAISNRSATAGAWADVGQDLLHLAIGSKLKVVARVPSQWVPYLQGLEGFDFTVKAGEPPRRAALYSIDPVVNEASRSFEVIGTTPGEGLRPGLFANITLTAPEPVRTLWLPASAVVASDTPRVFLVEDGAVAVRRIQAGNRDDGMVEIRSGLKATDQVILEVGGLSRGLPVTVVE